MKLFTRKVPDANVLDEYSQQNKTWVQGKTGAKLPHLNPVRQTPAMAHLSKNAVDRVKVLQLKDLQQTIPIKSTANAE
jgi:predicted SAM-dependent methyltransferase